MDRRTVLTGSAAALLGAIGVGRVLSRTDAPSGPADAGPTGSASDAPSTSEATADVPVRPAPTEEPRAPSPTASAAEPETAGEAAGEPSPAPPEPARTALVVPVICRAAWAAAPVRDGLVAHELRRMTVHHTAVRLDDNRQAPSRLRGHQRYHQDQGWPDIAYHRGVDRNGNVYELRTTDARGDTFTSYDPAGHLLILAEGDFDQQAPTDAQLEGVARLLAWGATRFGLPLDTISGHRDHASTSCPGDALYARLPDLRARAAELVATGGVETASLCGEAGAQRVAAVESGQA